VRVFVPTKPSPKPLAPGQLPGVNAPSAEMGPVELGPGEVLRVPKGTVSYVDAKGDQEDTLMVWAPGYGITELSRVWNATADAAGLLLRTGLFSSPHDASGVKFTGRPDFMAASGEVAAVAPANMRTLQRLFDRGEACRGGGGGGGGSSGGGSVGAGVGSRL
jgi:hypothetical protein